MDLTKFNKVSLLETKEVVKLCDLPINVPQTIYSVQLMTTKYGETALIELTDNKVFLPKRVVPLIRENLQDFDGGKYSIVYKGLKDVKKPSMGTIFELVKSEYFLKITSNIIT